MPKYYVSVPVYASMGMYVEAKSAEDAVTEAGNTLYPNLCHQCANDVELNDDLDWDNATVEEIV